MRVEVSFTIPKADSYGATGFTSKVYPLVECQDILDKIADSMKGMVHFKPGMEIEILIKDDWEYKDES